MTKARFQWDSGKDSENQVKHGVSFAEAQLAFADPRRVIAEDRSTVRWRNGTSVLVGLAKAYSRCGLRIERTSSASLAQATGERANKFMSAKIKYTDEPLGNPKVVPDFLPRPEDLAFQDEGVKVTIALSKRSVEFFKAEAQKNNTQYQRMIRRLLDAYAEHHSRPITAGSRRAQKSAA